MTRFAEVLHEEWIAAPIDTVRSQFADLQHHIDTHVHPKLTLRTLDNPADGPLRYEQTVRLLGIAQRDVFERRFGADGSMTDRSIEGFNQGGSLAFRFRRAQQGERPGTLVQIAVRLPLPPLVGGLLKPLLEGQIRRELRAAAAEDKTDIEQRGYQPQRRPQGMLAAA